MKHSVIIIYLDMRKAFDQVPHKRLLIKLRNIGIKDPLHQWLQSFLSHRIQRVKVDNAVSGPTSITSGVIQGSVLGPALFLTYIIDIVKCFKTGSPFLFADDCKVVYSFQSHNIVMQLSAIQDDLSRLESWCSTWQMSFNPSKCHVLPFRCAIPQSALTLFQQPLTISQNVRDLGLYYSPTLNFSEHIHKITTSANRRCFLIHRHFSNVEVKMKL